MTLAQIYAKPRCKECRRLLAAMENGANWTCKNVRCENYMKNLNKTVRGGKDYTTI